MQKLRSLLLTSLCLATAVLIIFIHLVVGSCSPLLRTSLLKKPAPNKPKMPRKTKKTAKKPTAQVPPVPEETDSLPESVAREYEVGRMIGDGNFAIVKECIHRQTGEYYALKIIDKEICKGKEHMIASEVSILRKVRHPNIVHLYAEFDFPKQLYLVMELVKVTCF
jgi:doublecortin-like kinase 1/2